MVSPRALSLPLSALRERLEGSADADWQAHPDGTPGHGLSQPAGTRVSYTLALDAGTALAGSVRLRPLEWRDGSGRVRVSISVDLADGSWRELWSGLLAPASLAGAADGLVVAVEVPGTASSLTLGVDQHGVTDAHSVTGALWLDMTLGARPAVAAGAGASTSPQPRPTPAGPTLSVLTPVHDPPLEMLREAVDSVIAQSYSDWELQLVDDGSRNPEVIAELQRYAAGDARIHLHRHERAQGIAGATNTGLAHARGEYIALLDHDDTLAVDALERIAVAIAADPTLDMIYSDEDIVMDGRQIWVHHKQAWSPDVLRTNGYTCHLGVYRRELVDRIGGFRDAFNGSQDVDMILRLVEQTDRIAHIPEILYHWRAHAASTAGGDAKPYAYVAARNAIAEHLARTGIGGTVDFGPPGLYRVVHPPAPSTQVAIAVAAGDPAILAAAARTWMAQPHRNWRAVVVTAADSVAACEAALTAAGLDEGRVILLAADMASPAAALELAAERAAADADQLLLMQSPVVGLTHDWMTRLIGYGTQPGVAAAGPVVLGPDGRVRDAGVALVDGAPLFLIYGQTTSMDNYFGFGTSVHDVSAVATVAMTSSALLERVGGLRTEFGELALADFCLRASEGTLRTVTVPDARVQCQTEPVNDLAATSRFIAAHASDRPDPYYNRNYASGRGDFLVTR